MRSTRAAPGGDAGRRDEAATRGPNGVHGRDPRPSARIMGGEVRYRTSVRSPTPQKVLRAHERRVQGDDSHLHGGSLAACSPNRHRTPCPVPEQEPREPHPGQMGIRAIGGPGAPRIHGFVALSPRRRDARRLPRHDQGRRRGAHRSAGPILEPPTPPPQTPAATGRIGTAWSRTRCCDARRRSTPCTRTTCPT